MTKENYKKATEILKQIDDLEDIRLELGQTEKIDEIRFYSNGTEHCFCEAPLEFIKKTHVNAVNIINKKIDDLESLLKSL